MLNYISLSDGLQEKIRQDQKNQQTNPCRFPEEQAVRRDPARTSDQSNLWRPAFVRDIEKILHCPFYNRYADKTQVFSFYKNDDITRRGLHVQLVSRIARNIGRVLGLNLDLIEAISLGHDIGHTPFGHAGERFLSELFQEQTGRVFCHNVHSVRVLDRLLSRNLTLQTLDGILCHNGEFEQQEYRPRPLDGFSEFDQRMERCYTDPPYNQTLVPSTLEACVVRISDIIAYLGKDRQDAVLAKVIPDTSLFTKGKIGVENAELINNLTVDILEHSYGKDYIYFGKENYRELKRAKAENNQFIYLDETINQKYNETIQPMFRQLYFALLDDLNAGRQNSVIFRHHIDFIRQSRAFYSREDYLNEEPNQIVVDYLASMTDDYFIDLYHYLFPKGTYDVKYISYFGDNNA